MENNAKADALAQLNESIEASRHYRTYFEIIDERYDSRAYYASASKAIAGAIKQGVSTVVYHADGNKADLLVNDNGMWKTAVRTKNMELDTRTGMSIDVIQKRIDFDNAMAIEQRQKIAAGLGKALEPEAAEQQAIADISAFARIDDQAQKEKAASIISSNANANAAYKAALENKKLHSSPSLSEEIDGLSLKNKADPIKETAENIIAQTERQPRKEAGGQTADNPDINVAQETPNSKGAENKARTPNQQAVPPYISSRYLNVENKYYLPDKALAFEDRGNKLKLETENREVIKDALAIAQARGWESITISGSDNFKHQVWREASIKGFKVAGYIPTELEVAELNHSQAIKEEKEKLDAITKPIDTQDDNKDLIRGILVGHGPDNYLHDPAKGKSYYVTVDIGDGKEITRWGTDFKRAFAESHSLPQIGDAIVINNTGKHKTDIPSPALDGQGNPVEEKRTVAKNTWQVEKAAYYDTLREQAEALRIGKEIERRVIEDTPQLADAIAVSRLGEKIAEHAKVSGALRSQEEVDTLVKHINAGLAEALEKGKKIKTPEIQDYARRAAVEANNITNDHKPPEIIKATHQNEIGMAR